MSPITVLAVGLIGGVGAIARFLIDGSVASRVSTTFPIGTFVVNMLGSFGLGLLAGFTSDQQAMHLLATGLLGSFTTFSTWMLESERLGEDGEGSAAVLNIALSLAGGISLAWIGTKLGGAL